MLAPPAGPEWPLLERTYFLPNARQTPAPRTQLDADSIVVSAELGSVPILEELRAQRHDSLDRLVPVVYQELRAIAHRQLAGRGHAASLATTALVNEAYLKLVDQSRAEWRDRAHFFSVAAVAMRHVLVDRARSRVAFKRGGTFRRVTLDEAMVATEDCAETLLAIDDALDRLAAVDPRLARVVECRFYGGLSEEEIAEVLGVTVRTVERDWVRARLLLRRALES